MKSNEKNQVMSRIVNMLILTAAVVCISTLSGCSGPKRSYSEVSDEQILASFQNDPCIRFLWYGNNQWRLNEDGWNGGGHLPYDIYPENEGIYSHAHARVLLGEDTRLIENPKLLYPLFDSRNTEVVLAALYCYSKAPSYKHEIQMEQFSPTYQSDLGTQLRRLLYEHRDVRVRCMAADLLREKDFLTIKDIDRMLSDENLSVQIMGIRSVISVQNGMPVEETRHFKDDPNSMETDLRSFSRAFYQTRKQLIPVLLKHLNDNHFYIRATCYSAFLSLVEHRISLPDGRMMIKKPKMLAKRFEWERESWWNCRDQQQKLIAWWKDNDETIMNYSNPDLYGE